VTVLPRAGLNLEDSLARISKWRFEPTEDPAITGCSLDVEKTILTVLIRMR